MIRRTAPTTGLLGLTIALAMGPIPTSATEEPTRLAAPSAAPGSSPPPAPAPDTALPSSAVRFRWAVGDSLTYRVTQQTSVKETTLDETTDRPVTTETRTSLTLTRRWTVKQVDANGVATLEMTITALRNEFGRPDSSTLVLDSANPENAKEMAGYLNVPVVTIRVDPVGRLTEIKEAKAGTAGRLQAELPFRLTLPEAVPAPGLTWDRSFTLKLDPPHGTGESYDFSQRYTVKAVQNGLLVVGVETSLKNPPQAAAEQIPLIPLLWSGEVYFHAGQGRYAAARLKAKGLLVDHLGEGTRFEYESVYNEDWVTK